MINKIKTWWFDKMWKFGAFYYSPQLARYLCRGSEMPVNYCKLINGKIVRYTEWVSEFPFYPPMSEGWRDTRFLGFGFFHHQEWR